MRIVKRLSIIGLVCNKLIIKLKEQTNSSVHENKLEAISNMIETENQNLERGNRALKILVTDESGKVVYKTKQAQEEQIDLHNTIRNATSFAINYSNGQDIFENTRKEFIAFFTYYNRR